MKFEVIVGNPPYQGVNHQQIYPKFYLWARNNCNIISMIFPTGWRSPKRMHGLGIMNNSDVKYDKQIVYIYDIIDVFKGISGAKNTNIVYWKKGYDNGLGGKQLVYTDGENPQEIKSSISKSEVERLPEVLKLVDCVRKKEGDDYIGVDTITSGRGPYNLQSDFLKYPTKYGMEDTLKDERNNKDDIRIFGKVDRKRVIKFIDKDYKLPTPHKGNQSGLWKVLIPRGWGGMDGSYLGGSYSSIPIAGQTDICTDSYLECGKCKSFDEVKKHSKYCMSKFARALLMNNKFDFIITKSAWKSVPIQDYTEDFWNSDNINDIDEGLFNKYNVPEDIRQFVRDNIQPKTVDNIIGYDGKDIDLFYKV